MPEKIVEFNSVSKSYKNNSIFRNLSFSFLPGKFMISGRNGLGKTTLLEMIFGMRAFQSGHVICLNSDVRKEIRKIRAKVSYLPIAGSYPEFASVNMIMKFLCGNEPERAITTLNLLTELEAQYLLKERVGNLSSGETSIMRFALSMGMEKPLIILDEPFTNVDIKRKLIMVSLLRKINKSFIITSHQESYLLKGIFEEYTIGRDEEEGISKMIRVKGNQKMIIMSSDDERIIKYLEQNKIWFNESATGIRINDSDISKLGEISNIINFIGREENIEP